MAHALKFALIATALFCSTSVVLARDGGLSRIEARAEARAEPVAAARRTQLGVPPDTANGPRGKVTMGGYVIGQDPDLNIRMQILREQGSISGE